MDHAILLHRGAKFASRGAGLFIKDVIHDGEWVHPLTNQEIKVVRDIRMSMQENMAKWLANGNKVPMPDGHSTDTARNKGFWPGPFVAMGEDVLGIAQPTDPDARKAMENGSADAVSVDWWSKYTDSNKIEYENIFDHICLTNYPVITKQRNFIALSGKQADSAAPLMMKALLDVAAPADDEELLRALEDVHRALRGEPTEAELDALIAGMTPAERLAAAVAQGAMELGGHINKDGTFKGGFKGCVASGKSRALCAYIGRRAGKIK